MLVSKKWIEKHRHDLDDWVPKIEISRPNGSKDTFTIKSKEVEDAVIKIMRENRKKWNQRNKKGGK